VEVISLCHRDVDDQSLSLVAELQWINCQRSTTYVYKRTLILSNDGRGGSVTHTVAFTRLQVIVGLSTMSWRQFAERKRKKKHCLRVSFSHTSNKKDGSWIWNLDASTGITPLQAYIRYCAPYIHSSIYALLSSNHVGIVNRPIQNGPQF